MFSQAKSVCATDATFNTQLVGPKIKLHVPAKANLTKNCYTYTIFQCNDKLIMPYMAAGVKLVCTLLIYLITIILPQQWLTSLQYLSAAVLIGSPLLTIPPGIHHPRSTSVSRYLGTPSLLSSGIRTPTSINIASLFTNRSTLIPYTLSSRLVSSRE